MLDGNRMVVWDLRYSLTTGARRVEGHLVSPELGEDSAFAVVRESACRGRSRSHVLPACDWAIDGSSRRRKVMERAAMLLEAAASNPALRGDRT